jgi:hypothetical protein
MSDQSSERPSGETPDEGPLSVPDEQLPEDLRPSEDNPLAEPVGDEVPDDILKDTAEERRAHDSSTDADAGSGSDAED